MLTKLKENTGFPLPSKDWGQVPVGLGINCAGMTDRDQLLVNAFAICSSSALTRSPHRMCFGKLPGSVENFLTRTIETYDVVPTGHDRQAIRGLAVAAAELNGD